MPLDEFQKAVIAVISRNRGPESPFTDGAVIQQHGTRLTDDEDIVVADDEFLDRVARTDLEALEAAGFTVQLLRSYPGFRNYRVMKPMTGRSGPSEDRFQGLQSEMHRQLPMNSTRELLSTRLNLCPAC